MAATSPGIGAPKTVTLSTALQAVTPAAGVAFVYLSCPSIVYLVYSGTLADGGVLPADYFPIPASTLFAIPVVGPPIFIAAASGTPVANLLGSS